MYCTYAGFRGPKVAHVPTSTWPMLGAKTTAICSMVIIVFHYIRKCQVRRNSPCSRSALRPTIDKPIRTRKRDTSRPSTILFCAQIAYARSTKIPKSKLSIAELDHQTVAQTAPPEVAVMTMKLKVYAKASGFSVYPPYVTQSYFLFPIIMKYSVFTL